MQLTEEKALQVALDFIKNKQYKKTGKPRFVPAGSREAQDPSDTWVVPLTYELFGLEETDYLSIDDRSGAVMYVNTKHGYLYGAPPGAQSLRRDTNEEEDDENWDDL